MFKHALYDNLLNKDHYPQSLSVQLCLDHKDVYAEEEERQKAKLDVKYGPNYYYSKKSVASTGSSQGGYKDLKSLSGVYKPTVADKLYKNRHIKLDLSLSEEKKPDLSNLDSKAEKNEA